MPTAVPRCSGITVIEILVSLVISLIILGAVVTVMYNSRANSEISQMKSGMQERGRFAMHFLTEDLRNAGFFGCNNELIGGSSTAQLTAANGGSGATDTLTITYANPEDSGVVTTTDIPATIGDSNYSVTVAVADSYCSSSPCDLGDVNSEWSSATQAVISNCGGSTIVSISNVNTSANTLQISSGSDIGIFFEAGATIKRLVSAAYTVGPGENGVDALFRNGVEMVEGIENTQFLYRTSAGSQTSLPAWSELQAIQVGLLARTVSNERLESNTTRQYGLDTDAGTQSILGETLAEGSIQGSRHTYASLVMKRNN